MGIRIISRIVAGRIARGLRVAGGERQAGLVAAGDVEADGLDRWIVKHFQLTSVQIPSLDIFEGDGVAGFEPFAKLIVTHILIEQAIVLHAQADDFLEIADKVALAAPTEGEIASIQGGFVEVDAEVQAGRAVGFDADVVVVGAGKHPIKPGVLGGDQTTGGGIVGEHVPAQGGQPIMSVDDIPVGGNQGNQGARTLRLCPTRVCQNQS